MQNQRLRLSRGVVPIRGDDGEAPEPLRGYKTTQSSSPRFTTVFDIAASADEIPSLFTDLVDLLLPPTAYLILEVSWQDPTTLYLSRFMARSALQAALREVERHLVEDGMTAFGLAWYDETSLAEVFVDEHKTIRVFTSRPEVVRERLWVSQFAEDHALALLSQGAHAHLALPDTMDLLTTKLVQALEMRAQPAVH